MPQGRGQGAGIKKKVPGPAPKHHHERPSPQAMRNLLKEARKAAANAYAPYSNFPVGAALLLADGKTVLHGCNVENNSYGLAICAERVAVSQAIAHGFRDFTAVGVVCTNGPNPCYPCGACRQFIAEFGRHIWIILEDEHGEPVAFTSNQFLPHTFYMDGHVPED